MTAAGSSCDSKHVVREMRLPVCLILFWSVPIFGFWDFWRPAKWLRLWRDKGDDYDQQGASSGDVNIERNKCFVRARAALYETKKFNLFAVAPVVIQSVHTNRKGKSEFYVLTQTIIISCGIAGKAVRVAE